MTKSKDRVVAEESWYKLLDAFDKSRYNSNLYRTLFNNLDDSEFTKFMEKIANEEDYVTFELDSEERMTMGKIFDICDELGFKTHKYVAFRDNVGNNPEHCALSPEPALILYLNVKRLVQMLSKKNSAASDISKINPMTGTVTSSSKSAGINNTQTYGLITTGQFNVIKELMSCRSDDIVSKQQLISDIERYGRVSINDLNIDPRNKQSLNTLMVFLRGVGIQIKTV